MRHSEQIRRPLAVWLAIGLAAAVAPATGLLLFVTGTNPGALALMTGPVLAISLMGVGMIAAAATGRLWLGIALALLTGAGLVVLALASGLPAPPRMLATLLALAAASFSFAARGALFARSGGAKGWWIAVAVVAGEAAIVATAVATPDALPGWLLALLPAQWATIAFRAALGGADILAAGAVLLALGGTAVTTLLVAALWPRRWPYLIMFSAWIGLSALVYHAPSPPVQPAEPAQSVALCRPVPFPFDLKSYLTTNIVNIMNPGSFFTDERLGALIRQSRLDGFGKIAASVDREDTARIAVLQEMRQTGPLAVANLMRLAGAAA